MDEAHLKEFQLYDTEWNFAHDRLISKGHDLENFLDIHEPYFLDIVEEAVKTYDDPTQLEGEGSDEASGEGSE
jgi:hypothetical protein